MEKFTAMLTKRLGPLPIWSWAVVAVAAILAYAYWRKSQEPDYAIAPVATPDQAPADAGFLDDVQGIPGGVSTEPVEREITFTSNEAWARYVVDRLTIRGEDPVAVTNALNKVLYGQEVTLIEAAIYNDAVRRYGPPPESVPVIKIKPAPQEQPPQQQPPPVVIPTSVVAPANVDLYGWVTKLNSDYPGLNTSFTILFGWTKNDPSALNPEARNYMTWKPGPPEANYKIPVFNSSRSVRIR